MNLGNGVNLFHAGQAIETLFLNLLCRELHTIIPGKIHEIYANESGKCVVDVTPLIKTATVEGNQISYPVATNVLLMSIGSADTSIFIPAKKDDLVLLAFSERALDRWNLGTTVADSYFGRNFDLSDAFAIPFNFNFLLSTYPVTDDMVINHKGQKITIKSSGEIDIGGTGLQALCTAAFKTYVDSVIQVLQLFLVAPGSPPAGGPLTPANLTALAAAAYTALSALVEPTNSLTSQAKAQ